MNAAANPWAGRSVRLQSDGTYEVLWIVGEDRATPDVVTLRNRRRIARATVRLRAIRSGWMFTSRPIATCLNRDGTAEMRIGQRHFPIHPVGID